MSTRCRFLLVAGMLVSMLAATGVFADACTRNTPSHSKQEGMSYATWQGDDYATADSDTSLENLKETGTKWISLVVTWYQDEASSTTIHRDDSRTPSDSSLIHAISKCHSLGMSVMLKPTVDLLNGEWRGNISFYSDSEWTAWFSSYENFILYYADLGTKHDVEQFCIGVEYKKTVQQEARWRHIIADVRVHYAKNLVYASNWDEYKTIGWWDALDLVGIDAYFPLTNRSDPTIEELQNGWAKWRSEIDSWREGLNRQILFTEIGYCSQDGTNIQPWNSNYSETIDMQEQADCCQAAFQTFWDEPWFAGMYWWVWSSRPQDGGVSDRHYTPHDKPAETVLADYYRKG